MCFGLWTPPAGTPPKLVVDMTPEQAVIDRLGDQLAWYDRKAAIFQARYKLLKLITLIAASAVPVFAVLGVALWARIVTAALGVIVAVCEGAQQLNQYQQNWIAYRATAEALKHEMYMFTARIGAYADDADRHRRLAQTIESLVSAEHAKWIASQAATSNGKPAAKKTEEAAKPPSSAP